MGVSLMMFSAEGLLDLGAIAQLVERVLCKHEVVGSIPSGSTTLLRPTGLAGCPPKRAARRRTGADTQTSTSSRDR